MSIMKFYHNSSKDPVILWGNIPCLIAEGLSDFRCFYQFLNCFEKSHDIHNDDERVGEQMEWNGSRNLKLKLSCIIFVIIFLIVNAATLMPEALSEAAAEVQCEHKRCPENSQKHDKWKSKDIERCHYDSAKQPAD
jgi:hypothetical protein